MQGQSGQRLGYIPAVDGLRAVAVLSVIGFHLWPAALPGGFTGVDIFFVISGFVVTGSLLGRDFATLRALAGYFYARRLVRILPALLAMALATILATQLFIPEGWLSPNLGRTGLFSLFGLSNVALAAGSDTYFGPLASFNPFTHTWSLGVEEQFYLAFPFLLYWHHRLHAGRAAIRVVLWASAGSLLLCAVLGAVAPRYAFYLIFARFWELGAGMLLCLTREQWQPRLAALTRGPRTTFIAASVVLVALGFVVPEGPLFPFPAALLPVAGSAGLIAAVCAFPDSRAAWLLARRPVVAIGLLSYSLYLWHWPVIVLFRWTAGLDTLPLQLAALAVAVGLATASYRLIERPLRASRRIATQPRGRVILASGLTVAIAAVLGANLIVAHDRLTLSVTRDRAAWYADPDRPLAPELTHCDLAESGDALAGGRMTAWSPKRCRIRAAGFALFVAGDSHGLAYAPALRQLAAELGVPVRLYFRADCPYLRLSETMASRPRCAGYFAAIEADIAARAKPGDVIFLPGLRLRRFTNQFPGDADLLAPRDDRVTAPAFTEARAAIGRLAQSGASLLIEAPKPIFRSPAFRCADWFNRGNPICDGGLTVPRGEEQALRAPLIHAMAQLAGDQPALSVWDPFPRLCPGDPCEAVPGGRPLFFDGDHPSGLGNDRIYPSLRDAILKARGFREP